MTVTADDVRRIWDRLPAWARSALYALDRYLNWRLGGDRNETISRRLRNSRDRGEWEGQLGCHILDRFDPGHCDRA